MKKSSQCPVSLPVRLLLKIINLPAMVKGVKFGDNSFFAPPYDFLRSQMKNIKLDNNVLIDKHAWLQTLDNGQIKIGSNTKIGRNFHASSRKKIIIGEGCLISYNVSIHDQSHTYKKDHSPNELELSLGKELTIGKNCFIGAKVTFLEGSGVGDNCVVGANSVVTKKFPHNVVITGVPAKIIKEIR